MGFSKISADADLKGGVWHILPSGEHRESSPLAKLWCTKGTFVMLCLVALHHLSNATALTDTGILQFNTKTVASSIYALALLSRCGADPR